ncbi:MAG: VWA domain-containing protein [Spirochaetaceae bacterium]|nr:MAG: VWA domain-containing protein [Spirochaetaceae bacterium]
MKRSVVLLLLCLGAAAVAVADVTISQVDPGRLLTRQQVDLFVSVTDRADIPVPGLSADSFRVFESADGERFTRIANHRVRTVANLQEGISFFLLLDNSGSMYDTIDDEPTDDVQQMRMTHAKRATRVLLEAIENPNDRVGLAEFNTFYTLHSPPIESRLQIERMVEAIERPGPGEGFTELYAGIIEASREVADLGGRTVLIVLSDGENYPFFVHRGQPHPQYGQHVFDYQEAIGRLQDDGISLFAIHFGTQQDDNLDRIAQVTGGRVFDARDDRELAGVYLNIRDRVLQEYRISYAPTMEPAERKYVRVEYVDADGDLFRDTRYYYSSTILGSSPANLGWLALIPLLLAVGLWLVMRALRFQNKRSDANLEIIAGPRAATRMFALRQGQTIIGGADNADLTIHGSPAMRAHHATVVHDPKSGRYRVESSEEIMVNNRPTTRRDLQPGDVMNIAGTIVVFDEGEQAPPPKEGGRQKKR